MQFDVLVTGTGGLLGQGIMKALRSSRRTGRIVAVDASPLAVGLHVADRAHLVPLATSERYVSEVIRIAREERVSAILCGTDTELGTLAGHRPAIESATGAKLITSDPRAVTIANDKWLTVQFLKEHGYDAPRSALADGALALADEVGFPLFAKPRGGSASIGVVKVRTQDDLARALESPGMIVQEYLTPDDEEYTVGALVFDGRCRATVSLKRTLRHGNTHTAVCDVFPEVDRYVAEVASRLPGAFGPTNFQLRLTARGPVVFEINARFSGTTPLRAELGFNEVEAVLEHVLEGKPIPDVHLRPGLVLRWMAEVLVPLADAKALAETGALASPKGKLAGISERPT